MKSEGKVAEGISCRVETGRALVQAGLHPGTGGNGMLACSGDLLLEALVVSKEVPVGFKSIRLQLILNVDATPEQIQSLSKLTE